MKLTCNVKVKNRMGLHTRPATAIVKMLQNCKSDVQFTTDVETADAKSILSILMLAAQEHSDITVTIDGEDANEIRDKLVEGFETQFGEMS